jgi:hypothetical protein
VPALPANQSRSRSSAPHFRDKDLLKLSNLERIPIGEAIPLRRDTL